MVLETSDDAPFEAPDASAIDRALDRLQDRQADWLALLAEPHHLMSVARGRQGLVIEVVRDRVRRCGRELTAEQTAEALRAFARGDTEWQLALPWKDVTHENAWATLVLLAAAAIALLLVAPRLVAFFRYLGAR